MRQTRLWEYRREHGLTMAQLAGKVGYNPVYLYRIKSGALPITPNFEARIAFALGVPREFLFYDAPGEGVEGEAAAPEVRAGSGPSPPRRASGTR